jgi:FkbM family methyltransferase
MSMKSVATRFARRAVRSAGAATIFSSMRQARLLGFEALGARQEFVLCNLPGKEMYVVSARDEIIGRELFLSGEFDFEKFEFAYRLLQTKRPGWRPKTLLDVGGNIGTISIPAVARGYAERAIAIEPDPQNCRLLRANIELNGLSGRIDVHEMAAGEQPGHVLELELSDYNLGDHRIRAAGVPSADSNSRQSVSVTSTTLDSVCAGIPAGELLVWMDVQGYEGFVLAGSSNLLAQRPPLVLEFWPGGMARTGSFPLVQSSLQSYSGFIDLAEGKRVRAMSELQSLYDDLGPGEATTDILVI